MNRESKSNENVGDLISNHQDDTKATIIPIEVHYSSASSSKQSMQRSVKDEEMSVLSTNFINESPIYIHSKNDTDEIIDRQKVNFIIDESSMASSTQQEDVYIIEEPIITLTSDLKRQYDSRNVSEFSSVLESTNFNSQIKTRIVSSSRSQLVRSMNFIKMAMQEFLLNINIEDLPELFKYREEANSLLDCAVAAGMGMEELQQWEVILRNVECGIFHIQVMQEENIVEESNVEDDIFKEMSENVKLIQEQLEHKNKLLHGCQKEVSRANLKVLYIIEGLKKLEHMKQCAEEKMDMIKQTIAVMEEDWTQLEIQISELEQISIPLNKELEIVSQKQQELQERHDLQASQAKTAKIVIKNIKAMFS